MAAGRRQLASSLSVFVIACAWGGVGCSNGDRQETAPPNQEAARASLPVELAPSLTAKTRLREIRDRFKFHKDSPPEDSAEPLADLPVLRPGEDVDFEPVAGGRLLARTKKPKSKFSMQRPAVVELPAQADGKFSVTDPKTGIAVFVEPENAKPSRVEVADGLVLYRGANPRGGDVIHRVHHEGTEDYTTFTKRPAEESLSWRVDVSRVPGLRLVGNVLEFLDTNGDPRLRMSKPYVVDSRGTGREARIILNGCQADTNPRGPWDRPITPPGADTCRVSVAWSDALAARSQGPLTYPVIVDPSWETTGSMAVGRAYFAAAKILAPTYRILVAGGEDSMGPLSSCELYNFSAGTWAATSHMQTARTRMPAVKHKPTGMLVIGGWGGTANAALTSAEEYHYPSDPMQFPIWARNKSYLGPTASDGRYLHTATLAGTQIFVRGGKADDGSVWDEPLECPAALTPNCVKLPVTATVKLRLNHTATLLNSGKVLVAGGAGDNSAELYNPSNHAFTSTGAMVEVRANHDAQLLDDGRVVVFGDTGSYPAPVSVEIYDESSNSWSSISTLNTGRASHASTVLSNGWILTSGGESTDTAEMLDPTSLTWHTTTPLHQGRYAHAMIDYGARAYAIGGIEANTADAVLASVERYIPDSNGTACTFGGQCASGFCADHRCCDSACTQQCKACSQSASGNTSVADGVCTNIVEGKNDTFSNACEDEGVSTCGSTGVCDGSGACQKFPDGTECEQPSCIGTDKTSKVCDTGVCTTVVESCSPYACIGDDCVAGACNDDSDCVSAYYCDPNDTTCKQRVAQGGACEYSYQCSNGNPCVDGVCCENACDTLCQACSNAIKGQGIDGDCGPIAAGDDPDDECGDDGSGSCLHNGSCDGAGQCELYASGTICGDDVCVQGFQRPQLCDGDGICKIDTSGTECHPFVCESGGCLTACIDDGDCVTGYYCGTGQCEPKIMLGLACTAGNQCTSGFCTDGVCCDSACTDSCWACTAAKKGSGTDGECGYVASGMDVDGDCPDQEPANCDYDGTCNGSGACRVYAAGTVCGAAQCVPGNKITGQICDGIGSCINDTLGTDCSPYVCSGNACSNPCYSNSDCVTGYYCETNGTCAAEKAKGEACSKSEECASGYCVDGVCCDTQCSDLCVACAAELKASEDNDGTCGPAAAGEDPHNDCPDDGVSTCQRNGVCDGSEACQLYAANTPCGATTCNNNAVKGLVCNGTGVCQMEANGVDCHPYVCEGTACATSCVTDSSCVSGWHCNAGVCEQDGELGDACTDTSQCSSGECVDGVCCDKSCTGQCEACDVTGSEGTCTAVTGAPHGSRDACNGSGVCQGACDGSDRQSCAYPGAVVTCGSTCADGELTPRKCNGSGQCEDQTPVSCAPYVCESTEACATTCASNDDCQPPAVCDGSGACLEADVDSGAGGSGGASGTGGSSGTGSDADASTPGAGDVGVDSEEGGCGCRTAGGKHPTHLYPLLLAGLALLRLRRRR